MRVYVINQRNQPIMPTTPQKARKLLKQGKAKVIKRTPFTIQLLYPSGESKQSITMDVRKAHAFRRGSIRKKLKIISKVKNYLIERRLAIQPSFMEHLCQS